MDARAVVDQLPELLLVAVAATDTAVVLTDATDPSLPVVWVNAAFETASGYASEQVLGHSAGIIDGPETSGSERETVRTALLAGLPVRTRLLSYRPDGSTWWNEMHISPVRDPAGRTTHFIGIHHDVTAQVEAHDRTRYAATHDSLTGLANRASFTARLERELDHGRRDGRAVAVLFFDVDDFKRVNDDHGHAAGDLLLTEVGQRLHGRLRGEDLVARVGGDEFLALVVDLTGDAVRAAARVLADLAAALSRPFLVDGTAHRIRISTGLAVQTLDGSTAAELLAAADAAMYLDKPGGRAASAGVRRAGAVRSP